MLARTARAWSWPERALVPLAAWLAVTGCNDLLGIAPEARLLAPRSCGGSDAPSCDAGQDDAETLPDAQLERDAEPHPPDATALDGEPNSDASADAAEVAADASARDLGPAYADARPTVDAAPRDLGPAFVVVPSGTFTMGSTVSEPGRSDDEGPLHEVTITRSFLLKRTEVTQGEWAAAMGGNPAHFAACGQECPVEQVTWDDAVAYVNALSASEGLTSCYGGGPGRWTFEGLDCDGYRLPTEAEWEYAARAGAGGPYDLGSELDDIGWFGDNSGGTTRPVATKRPNAWGLHDLHGNVWEWVQDWYSTYSSTVAVVDPSGPTRGGFRVARGGSWRDVAALCRSAQRYTFDPQLRNATVGLRPSRTLPRVDGGVGDRPDAQGVDGGS